MAKKKENTEEKKEEKYYNFATMTDEEVDSIILAVIEECKANTQCKSRIKWTEPLLALRNSVIFNLMYKRGYSKRKTIDTLRARWNISEQRCYEYIKEATNALMATYNEDVETIRTKQLEKLQSVYDECLARNKQKEAIQALDQINKLNGLYKEEKTITVNEIKFEFD